MSIDLKFEQILKKSPSWSEAERFYPSDFNKKNLIEGPYSVLVIGEILSYEFLKQENLKEKLELIFDEINSHLELAPDFFIGLRCFKLIDEIPRWESVHSIYDKHNLNLEYFDNASDIALVTRNIPSTSIASEIIKTQLELEDKSFKKLCNILKKFYAKDTRAELIEFSKQPKQNVNLIQQRLLDSLPNLEYKDTSRIFFNTVVPKLISLTKKRIVKAYEFFYERAISQDFKRLHGNLKLENICVKPIYSGGNDVNIISKKLNIYGDPLEDIADLYVEFLSKNCEQTAHELKNYFVGLKEERLFNLLTAVSCLKKINSIESEAVINKLLIKVFSSLYFLSKPIVIHIEPSLAEYKTIFSSYFDCLVLDEPKTHNFLFDKCVSLDQRFLKLKDQVRKYISCKKNIIITSSFCSKFKFLEIEREVLSGGGIFINILDANNSKRTALDFPLNTWFLSSSVEEREKYAYVQNILQDAFEEEIKSY